MRIWIASIGNRARGPYAELAGLYLDRIAGLVSASGAPAAVEAPVLRSEDALWQALEKVRGRMAPLLVLLDERGRQFSSPQFAAWLGARRDEGRQLVVFAVGPADGWTDAARKRAGMMLSLGPMTMAHELARLVLAEQLYRAFTILSGHPYHRQ